MTSFFYFQMLYVRILAQGASSGECEALKGKEILSSSIQVTC